MKIRSRIVGVVLLMCVAAIAFADTDANGDAARDTIAQINHLNWVVSKIKTYNNTIVLAEEYRQISPDKLNLNRIPDRDTLGKIMDMLDLLHGMISAEREMEEWRRTFEIRRKRQQFEFWRNQCGTAESTVSNLGWAGIASGGAVVSLSKSALSAYRDYETLLEDLEDEAMRQKFKMETVKLERLHELNKSLLQSQWEMIQKYKFDDSLRVSDSDIALFIEALKDADHAHVYSRIDAMRDKFRIFPVYWYYLSGVALETGHREEALDACDRFFEVNRGLFRDDPMVGAVAMNKIYLLEKNEENKAEVRRLLNLVWKHNAGDVDWRKDYFCAAVYGSYLNDMALAVKVLTHAMATLENNVSDQLHALTESENARADSIDFADGESLWMCRKLMAEISSGKVAYDEYGLKVLCGKETTSSIDKLDYVGRMNAGRLWEVVGDDVEGVRVKVENKISWRGFNTEVLAEVPIRWLLSGDLSVRLELLRNDKCVGKFDESRTKRMMIGSRKVGMRFVIPRAQLQGVDALRLYFNHPDYPVSLIFASGSPYQAGEKASAPGLVMNDGNFNEGNLLENLRLMVASFCGAKYWRNIGGEGYLKESEPSSWRDGFAKTFVNMQPYASGSFPVQTNGVSEVVVTEDGGVRIRYKNESGKKIRPAVSVYLLNRYGAVLSRVDDQWKIKRLAPDEESESRVYEGNVDAVYIDIETAVR